MSWNHRVMRHVEPDGTEWFGVHEVFYDDNGIVRGWTEDAMDPFGDTLSELRVEVSRFMEATLLPVLKYENGDEVTTHRIVDGCTCRWCKAARSKVGA